MVHSAAAPAKFRRGDKPSPFGQEREQVHPLAAESQPMLMNSRPALVNRQGPPAPVMKSIG